MSRPERVDVKSDKILISSYRGATLTGPDAVITKKIIATGRHVGTDAANSVSFGTTSWRILGTSPNSLMNSRVYACFPITFDQLAFTRQDDITAQDAPQDWRQIQVGPRRNGLTKAMSTMSATINSAVSFSARSDELECFDDIFSTNTMPSNQGGRETGSLGPDARTSPSQFSSADGLATRYSYGGAEIAAAGVPADAAFVPKHANVNRYVGVTAHDTWQNAATYPHMTVGTLMGT